MRSTQSMSITFFLWHFEKGGFYWARRITLEIVRVGVTSGNLFSSWTTCYKPLNMLPLLAIPLSELSFESCHILSGECGLSFSFGWWQTISFLCFLFVTHCVHSVLPAGTQDWPGLDLTQVLCRWPQLQWGPKDNSHTMCKRQHLILWLYTLSTLPSKMFHLFSFGSFVVWYSQRSHFISKYQIFKHKHM